MASNITREGDFVVFMIREEHIYLTKLTIKGTLSIKDLRLPSDIFVGQPYGSYFCIGEDGVVSKLCGQPQRVDVGKGSLRAVPLEDHGQSLTSTDVSKLRSTITGDNHISKATDVTMKIAEGSASYSLKTVYAKEKWATKMRTRQSFVFQLLPSTPMSIARSYLTGMRNTVTNSNYILSPTALAFLLRPINRTQHPHIMIYEETRGQFTAAVMHRFGAMSVTTKRKLDEILEQEAKDRKLLRIAESERQEKEYEALSASLSDVSEELRAQKLEEYTTKIESEKEHTRRVEGLSEAFNALTQVSNTSVVAMGNVNRKIMRDKCRELNITHAGSHPFLLPVPLGRMVTKPVWTRMKSRQEEVKRAKMEQLRKILGETKKQEEKREEEKREEEKREEEREEEGISSIEKMIIGKRREGETKLAEEEEDGISLKKRSVCVESEEIPLVSNTQSIIVTLKEQAEEKEEEKEKEKEKDELFFPTSASLSSFILSEKVRQACPRISGKAHCEEVLDHVYGSGIENRLALTKADISRESVLPSVLKTFPHNCIVQDSSMDKPVKQEEGEIKNLGESKKDEEGVSLDVPEGLHLPEVFPKFPVFSPSILYICALNTSPTLLLEILLPFCHPSTLLLMHCPYVEPLVQAKEMLIKHNLACFVHISTPIETEYQNLGESKKDEEGVSLDVPEGLHLPEVFPKFPVFSPSILYICALNTSPTLLLEILLPFCHPSTLLLMHCPYVEPLVQAKEMLIKHNLACFVHISTPIETEYQVLPGRCRPEMTTLDRNGFIMSAILCEKGNMKFSETEGDEGFGGRASWDKEGYMKRKRVGKKQKRGRGRGRK
ncbi:tRNA (adenine(58)-N(1))-methyltransferase non-catalytic subunit TRM6 like protein [Aduncisulcus paluster]|uniref:tRNA (adenine(58)-N(1))-methyltransferase non-catalytic subunit TRM6 n=1 Tax=Aduncisulcus paluster TaxID=2918883 RepID=A0ABQ5KWY8_9EUKA|nr:tRNA (adenine(58)-N(1))-methyltransferase non-catalytic subunit TRM6 like protein [Aduncisulcus paluster]